VTNEDAITLGHLKSRTHFAIASGFEILSDGWLVHDIDEQNRLSDTAVIERLILPYVASGTVLVEGLKTFAKVNKQGSDHAANAIEYARKRGICADLHDVYENKPLDDVKLDLDRAFVQKFNAEFSKVDYFRCLSLAVHLLGTPGQKKERQALLDKLEWVSSGIGLKTYRELLVEDFGEGVTDEDMVKFHRQFNRLAFAFGLEAIRIKLAALGKFPTATYFDRGCFLTFEEKQTALLEVAVPKLYKIEDLIDFVSMDDYRRPMKRLQSYIFDLASSTKSTKEISEEIRDAMNDLNQTIGREKITRYFSVCKFVFGSAIGTIEDLIKLRLERIATRPFEIGQFIADQYYYKPEYERNPLFMAWQLSERYGQ
jgi:hypothetical protein